jgi:ceramide glucosyltransferase
MLEYIIIFLVAAGLIYTLTTGLLTRKHLNKKTAVRANAGNLPAISVLKPIKGVDDQLEANLDSFFNLDYPEYELIFGINDPDDPAVDVIKRLQKKYQAQPSKLIISSNHIGFNPKVNNLYNIYPKSRYDYILISDSNVRVGKDYLTDMAAHLLEPGVGLVTSVFRGTGAKSIGASFENLHLNTFVAGNVITVSRLFKRPITIGKSMLFRRDIVRRLSGFSSLANVLAEDHLLGVYIQKLGLSVKTADVIIDNYNEHWQFERFLNRHRRWAMMRKNLNIFHYMLELITNPVFLALIYSFASFNTKGLLIFLNTVLLKTLIDIDIARTLKSGFRYHQYLLLPVKDIVMGILWLVPFINNKINWRGSTLRIGKGTRLQPAHKGTEA